MNESTAPAMASMEGTVPPTHLSYKDLSHPMFLDNLRAHNTTTLKLVKTGECVCVVACV